ncbi:hypothetical protein, partial [Kingella kingae]|uniref:hypothetical protein n=1 Tax=Kingella kingae TaxID=504 RepID=UPI003D6E930C
MSLLRLRLRLRFSLLPSPCSLAASGFVVGAGCFFSVFAAGAVVSGAGCLVSAGATSVLAVFSIFCPVSYTHLRAH